MNFKLRCLPIIMYIHFISMFHGLSHSRFQTWIAFFSKLFPSFFLRQYCIIPERRYYVVLSFKWFIFSTIVVSIKESIIGLEQACATSGPRAACDPRNFLFRSTATTNVLSFVRPAISNIERSKTVKEFLISSAPNK